VSDNEGQTAKKVNAVKVGDLDINDEFTIVKQDDTGIDATKELMKIPGGGVVLVTNPENKILGVISVREILMSIIAGKNPASEQATGLMSTRILEVTEADEIREVMKKVEVEKPHAIVVTDVDGKFRGYFSPRDHREAIVKIQT